MQTTVPLENPEISESTGIILLSRNHFSMPNSLVALFFALRSIVGPHVELQLENFALRHQIGVLQRSVRKRPKLSLGDHFFWISMSSIWRNWRSTLVIVKPETVVAWHRKGFRLFWTWKVRHGQPGFPVVPREVRGVPGTSCGSDPTGVHHASFGKLLQTRHRHRRDQR